MCSINCLLTHKLVRSREMWFYSLDGDYIPIPGTIYAVYFEIQNAPNPCRKYHISSAATCGQAVADIVLPILRAENIYHKIVRDWSSLLEQTDGDFSDQAGKFITAYMDQAVEIRNRVMWRINAELQNSERTMPCPKLPTMRNGGSRPEDTRRYELPIFGGPKGPFIFGGFECDPRD